MLLAISLSGISFSGCATPPDVPVCIEVEPTRGWCTYTISKDEFFIDDANLYEGESWQAMNQKTVRVPAQSWAKIKAFILKICKKTGHCKKEAKTKFKVIDEAFVELGR